MARRRDKTQAAPALFGDWQRRVVLMLLFSGLALAILPLLVPPRGAVYWLVLCAAPVVGGVLGLVMGGARGAAIDTWLMGAPKARPDRPPPPAPSALPAPTQATLRAALVPVVLSELAVTDRLAPHCAAAVRALAAAAAHAPSDAALAADLPRLAAGLLAGSSAAAAEAEALAQRLAAPGGAA